MNGLVIGVAAELFDRFSSDDFLDGFTHGGLQIFQGFEQAVFHFSFQPPPDLFCRVEFRSIGWQKHQVHIGWNGQGLCFVKAGIIQQQDFEFLFVHPGKFIQKSLKVLGIALREVQQKMSAVHRRKSTIEVRGFKAVLKAAKRFYAFGRECLVRKG